MPWPSDEELALLVTRFRSQTLPKQEWTHAAHLSVGAWHVHTHGPDAALVKLRDGIRTLNESHGTDNTDSGGYHETITRAYVTLIASFLSQAPAWRRVAENVQQLLASPLAARDALLTFYTAETLFSVQARRDWVPPDRRPRPRGRVTGTVPGMGTAAVKVKAQPP
jgi:predicted dehydrogenase